MHMPSLNEIQRATPRPVTTLCLVAGIVVTAVAACGADGGLGPTPEISADVQQFVQLLNQHRRAVGCSFLSWNREVAAVAQAHSDDMVDRSFFDHTNPDGNSPFDRLEDAGVAFSSAAENIAAGQASAEAVLDDWLNSSGHRANIENCALTEHGVGLTDQRWTHVFIRPAG
jgi:uncharacterized protein YkwD